MLRDKVQQLIMDQASKEHDLLTATIMACTEVLSVGVQGLCYCTRDRDTVERILQMALDISWDQAHKPDLPPDMPPPRGTWSAPKHDVSPRQGSVQDS